MTTARSSGSRPTAELMRRRNFLSRWWFNLPMRDKGLLVVVLLPLTTLVAAVLIPIPYTMQQRETAGLIARVAETRDTARELFIALLDLEAGMRGYALTRNAAFLERVKIARQSTPGHLEHLESLLFRADDQKKFAEVTELVARELALADQLVPQDGVQASPDNTAIQRTLADESGPPRPSAERTRRVGGDASGHGWRQRSRARSPASVVYGPSS